MHCKQQSLVKCFEFITYYVLLLTGLFSSLLRLLATHFPHLSLVEDWLDDDVIPAEDIKDPAPSGTILAKTIIEGKEILV